LGDLVHSKSTEDWEQTEYNEQKNNDFHQYLNIQKECLKT
jgi:hypothetical protein